MQFTRANLVDTLLLLVTANLEVLATLLWWFGREGHARMRSECNARAEENACVSH